MSGYGRKWCGNSINENLRVQDTEKDGRRDRNIEAGESTPRVNMMMMMVCACVCARARMCSLSHTAHAEVRGLVESRFPLPPFYHVSLRD